MKTFLVMTTGGTIASVENKAGLIPQMTGEELLSYIPDIAGLCHVDILSICQIDSTNMNVEIYKKLVSTIQENYDKYDGFLILHGTDTMAYTSAALSYMIQNANKPIVLTGAQKPISYDSTDALINLRDSFYYMMHEGTRGIKVVFGGKVITGTRAKKVNSLSYQAFTSVNYPYVATVRNNQVIEYIQHAPYQESLKMTTKMSDRVFLLKLTPCSHPDIFDFIYDHYDVIVIEGFGVGGIPKHLFDALVTKQNSYPEGEKLLILSTQVMSEGSHVSIYEVGKSLMGQCDYLEARDMNLEAVVAKGMWIKGQNLKSFKQIKKLFYQDRAHDILGK